MRRVLIECRHREVTLTMESCAPRVAGSQPDQEGAVAVCPTCGSPRLTITAQADGDLPAGVALVQRALQPSGHSLLDAVASEHPEVTGRASPDGRVT